MDHSNSAGQVQPLRSRHSRCRHALGQSWLIRELPDAFRQILVRCSVMRDDFAKPGQDGEGILVIDFFQRRGDAGAEFQAEEFAARFQYPHDFAQGGIDAGDVAEAEGNAHLVELIIGEGQSGGIAGRPGKSVEQAEVNHAVAPTIQHGRIIIANSYRAFAVTAPMQAERNIARAAREVENVITSAWCHHGDELVFPNSMHAQRHQIIHQIIIFGDALKYVAHPRRFFFGANAFKSEPGGFGIGGRLAWRGF